MNDEVAVVHQYPLGIRVSFDTERPRALRPKVFFDGARDGLRLLRIGARTQDELVGQRTNGLDIENEDVFGFA